MNDFIFNLLMAVVVGVVGAVAKELIPYLVEKKNNALLELRRTKWDWVADIVDTVVRAVEQTLSDQLHGEDKKDEAVKWIRKLTYSAGIQLTDDQISAMIEAAVRAMNQETQDVVHELPSAIGFVPDKEDAE